MKLKTPSKPPPVIISMGEVLWDLFDTGPCFGGAAANFACHAAAQGAHATIVSAVGRDAHGRKARDILTSAGVDTSLLQETSDLPTGSVAVSLGAGGKPDFTIKEQAAWDNIAWEAPLAEAIPAAGAIYFGTLAQREPGTRETIHKALDLAKAAGVPRVLDINLRPPFFDAAMIRESIARCSILKLSDDEFPTVMAACEIPTGGGVVDSLRVLMEHHNLDLIALTRGADGALLVSSDEVVNQPGIATEVCDTVGAGDAFTASLVTGLLAGKPLSGIAKQACETAAFVCSHAGAILTSNSDRRTHQISTT